MTRVHAQTERVRQLRRPCIHRERSVRWLVSQLERPREGFSVQLDAVGTEISRPPDGRLIRVDEQAHTHVVGAQRADHAFKHLARCIGRPSSLARDLARPHRNQRALLRLYRVDQFDQIRPGIPFDVEFHAGPALETQPPMSRTSAAVMCRASARGCTVMPWAPAAMQTSTASRTEGTCPPREFRIVATLLTLTDNLITSRPTSLWPKPKKIRFQRQEPGAEATVPRSTWLGSSVLGFGV